ILVVLNENKRSTKAISDILEKYLIGANGAGNPSNMGMWDAVNIVPTIEPLFDSAINLTKEVSEDAKRLLGLAGEAVPRPRVRKTGDGVRAADSKQPKKAGPKESS